MSAPQHYNNDVATLYLISEQRNWCSYLFDIVKRLERRRKKGQLHDDIRKSLYVLELWNKEFWEFPSKEIKSETEISERFYESRGWCENLKLIVEKLELFQQTDNLKLFLMIKDLIQKLD